MTGITQSPAPAGTARPLTSVHDRVLALADRWDAESQAVREQSVRDGLHPALAHGHREANLIADFAGQLRAAVELDAGDPGPAGEPASAAALLSLAAEFDRRAADFEDRWVMDTAETFREAAATARARAGAPQSGPDGVRAVAAGGSSGTEALSDAQDGPGEHRLRPSALAAWRVTRETAPLIAAWCLGSWGNGGTARVYVPSPGGPLTAPEGYWVIRYGTSSTGAGLFWAVPGELFESACASSEGGA
jgi:hypothetical protein